MEHKTPAQNGVALTELPQISGFVSMSITEGSAAKKNWKPVWGTNVNTPPQPYTLSFYESPSERAQGAAPIVTISLKEYITKAIKIKVADSVDVNNVAALKLGFQITPKAIPGKDPSEVPSKAYFILPKPAEANNWNVAFRDLYGSMVRKVVKRTLPVVKAAPGAKIQAKQQPPKVMKSDSQQGHPIAKQQQQPPKTQQPQAKQQPQTKQQQKVQPTQPPSQQPAKSEEVKHAEKETPKEEIKGGNEDNEVIQTVIVETKSGIMNEEKEQNDGPFRSKRCPIPKHISRRWKESPIAAMTMSMNPDGTVKTNTTWGAAKPSMRSQNQQQNLLQSKNVQAQGKDEAKTPRSLPVLRGGRAASLSQHRIVLNNGAVQAKKAPEVATKAQAPMEKLDLHDINKVDLTTEKQTAQLSDESFSASAHQQKKLEPTDEHNMGSLAVKKQQSTGELHSLRTSQSACLPVRKQGMPQTKNGPVATKVGPTGKLLVKKQHLSGEAPAGKGVPSMNPPMKKMQAAPQGKSAPMPKSSPSGCPPVKKQQGAADPLVTKKINSGCLPVKKQPITGGDGVGAKCVVSKKVIVKSEVGVKKQAPMEAGGSGVMAPSGQVVAKSDVGAKKTQVLVKKQQVPKAQGNLMLRKAQSCKVQTGMKMQSRALPVVKKVGVKTQIKEVPSANQVDKEKTPVGNEDHDTKLKEAEMEQKRKQEEEEERARIEKEREEKKKEEEEERLRLEREEKEREEKLRIEMEEKKKKQEEEERAAAEKLRIEKEKEEERLRLEREEKEREEKLRIEKEMNANANMNVMDGFNDLEEELKKLEEEGRRLEEELTKGESGAPQPQEAAPETTLPEQPAQPQPHEGEEHQHHDHDHEEEAEGDKREHKKRRKLKMLNTGTGRAATGQGIRRVPKALLAPPLETLTEIDLSYNRLTKFPEEFYAVPGLRVLNLSCNQIPSIPADIVRLSCLEALVLRVNFVEEVPPEVFMLPNLTEFAAHNCHIAQVSIPPEGPAAPLRILTLGHNRLTALPENIGALGRTLKRLCVDANALQELPESVGELTSLTDLSIQDNFISELPGSLRNLQRLEMFEAWDNCLCGIPDEWVPLGEDGSVQPPFMNVTEFYLQKNEIAELPEWFFFMFGPRVQLIDLSANSLTVLPPLDGVPNLAALFVGANALETLPASLPTKILACLDISRNRLQELPALYELRELQTLNAGFNPLCGPLPPLPPGVIEAILPGLGLSTLPECSLPRLEILDLAINYLSDIPAGWLGSKSLRVCDVSHNMLASLPPALATAYESRSDFYMHVERNLFDLPLRSPSLWCDADKICPVIRIGVADTQGRRHTMEDSCTLHGDFLGDGQYDLICMYDGHGGSKYSEAAARIFPAELAACLCGSDGEAPSMEDVFRTAYHETNEAAAAELPMEVMQGTTAVAGLLAREDGVLHIANVGDTRAVLCRNGEAVRVSVDHKNLSEDEYLRIAGAGGYVTENGRLQGVLAMSRALGDVTLKPLVSDVPHYSRVDVAPGDEFVIFACDGVWDEVSDDVAVGIVRDALEEFGGDVDKACIKLRDWAFMAGSGDNISVIIIKFDF